jgi:16S rRNA (cytosine1402-N4)-methyltransferase
MTHLHIPVLAAEAIEGLQLKPNHWYIDATFGRGGHTRMMLQQGAKVIAFDCDRAAIEYGVETFKNEIAHHQLQLIHSNFDTLERHITELKLDHPISGILFDFGTSSNQLMDAERGFSFQGSAELDMRMDDRMGVKAKDLLAILPEKQLATLFFEFGGEMESKKIAKAIAEHRQKDAITTTDELVNLILRVKKQPRTHLHPATKVFQALRMAVNTELDVITSALPQALKVVPAGRIVTIAFHEGEDRIVKQYFKNWAQSGRGTLLTPQPITASAQEESDNPRSRSAKLRIFETV